MDSDSVAIFLPEECERKRQSCKPGRRFFCILALVAFLTLTVLFSVVLSVSVMNTNRYESLKKQYDDLRNNNEGKMDYSGSNIGLNTFIDNRINKSEFTWKREINARFGVINNNLRNIVKSDKKLRSRTNTSFENITNDLENLISTVDNLTLSLLRINATSDNKIRNVRNIAKSIKGDLNMTRIALTQINGSLRNDLTQISKSLSVVVKDLKKEISSLNSSTTAQANEFREDLNRTKTEFEQILVQISHRQNTTLHLKLEFQSNALDSKVKIVEKKLAQLSNNTRIVTKKEKKNLEILEKKLNGTRRNLKEAFQNEISRTKTSLNKKIESFETQLKSSHANVKTKIDGVKNELQTNITNLEDKQKNIEHDLSKTKVNFQGVDSKHERNISALAVKIKNIKNIYVRLKGNMDAEKDKRLKLEKELEDLRGIVVKLQNKANGILGINVPLVVFLVSFILLYI